MISEENNINTNEKVLNDSDVSGFEPIYMVEFLFEELPTYSREKLLSAMQTYTGAVKVAEIDKPIPSPFAEGKEVQPTVFFHLDHKVPFEDGEVFAQSCVYKPHIIQDYSRFDNALQQSFHWKEARETITKCKYSIRVHDLFAAGLPYKERFELILGFVRAVLETVPCKAMFWHTSDKIVEPQLYLEAVEMGEKLYGAVNLRLYSTGNEKEMIMDTRGLSALGIPDAQCHFYDLDPSEVARDLLVISKYLYDQGDIIKDGESIGTSKNKAYLCEHQHALVVPERYVLDLNPGAPHDGKQRRNPS